MHQISSKKNIFSKGFTLVELLIVLAIISALSAISTASFKSAKDNANKTKAKNDLQIINIAMERYFEDNEDYPPIGEDHNSATILNPNLPTDWALGTWSTIADTLDASNYGIKIPRIDPWGTPYGYDKNYKQYYFPAWSVICSAGPNKVLETSTGQVGNTVTGDDICIFFPDND